ncbi:MAG TPA: hypothetical protein VK465_16625 [Fibrobacteria bacterium]|nr:hypothetical protein [Fibrobacteria bacterium]
MNKKLSIAAVALCVPMLHAQSQDILKWAWEDGNSDGVWNYSETNWNFESANSWKNFAVSSNAYQGASALYFKYLNQDWQQNGTYAQGFGFATVPTSNNQLGVEPFTYQEYLSGKDLTSYKTVEFYIKGAVGANQSALTFFLRSFNGHNSQHVALKNLVTINDTWQKVSIPIADLIPPNNTVDRFQLFNVNVVGFYVHQNNNNVPFDFYVDNISFSKPAAVNPASEFKWAYEENGSDASLAYNGAWNYSSSRWDASASLVPGNQWGDIKTSLTEVYEGRSSIEINFNHMNGGYIDLYLSTSPAGTGVEPANFAEKDAPKNLSAYNTLRFFIKQGSGWMGSGRPDLSIDLIETPFRNANPVRLSSYLKDWDYTQWREVRIPLAHLKAAGTDLTRIKEIWFRLNDDFYAQSGTIFIDNIGFIQDVAVGEAMPNLRSWWDGFANPKGEYNYSTTSASGGSTINTANQWGDVFVSSAFIGLSGAESSLADLLFTHSGSGFAEADLTTAPANTGLEPTSFAERDAGKAIANTRSFLTFNLWTGNADPIRIRLKDAKGNSSAAVTLGTYRSTYGRYGFTVNIPTYVFEAPGFDFNQVKSVSFFVDNTVAAGTYNAKVTHIRFQRE